MDHNGFDYKALRMNTASGSSSNPSYSNIPTHLPIPSRPTHSRKPFAFVHTQSRNTSENQSAPSTSQIPQTSSLTRRHADPPRLKDNSDRLLFKQEPNDNPNPIFSNARNPHSNLQHTMIPQHRSELKTQSKAQSQTHKLRAFTMMAPPYDDHSYPQTFDAPQYSSSPKPVSQKFRPESQNYPPSSLIQSQECAQTPSGLISRSPSMQVDADFDEEDADLSQLMTKRMREAKLVKSKLAEQRIATAALESRLSTQAAASDASELALKSRISELEAHEAARQARAAEELRMAKSQTENAERKLQEAIAMLNDSRAAARKVLDEVGRNYADLQAYFKDLKADYNTAQDVIKHMSEELVAIRRSVADGIKQIEESDQLNRNAEARALIDELQNDRASAHQVIDMLRDKLHLLSTQVVEARERVAELEAIREGKIDRVESKVEELADKLVKKEAEGARGLADAVALEERLQETTQRLLEVSNTLEEKERELGAFREEKLAWKWDVKEKSTQIASLQASSADNAALKEEKIALECQVKDQCSRISSLQSMEVEVAALKERKIVLECEVKESRSKIAALQGLGSDLAIVREEKVALDCQVKDFRSRITALESLQTETSAKLQQSADQVHQRDTQLHQLRAELNNLENVKEQLQLSLETSQASTAKLTQEIHALTLREAVLQGKSGELNVQLSKLGAELSNLNTEALAREDELRQVNIRNSVLQERFDAQALTLKLAKEQSGDLQERLLVSESSHATKLESVAGRLNVEIAVLQEQKGHLQATLDQVTEDASTQRAAFLAASLDYENKLHKQEETHVKLAQADELRAVAAERDTADAKRLVDDLMQQVDSGRAELADMKHRLHEAASRKSTGMEGEVVVLRARLEELEGENSKLQYRARALNKRYKDGDLSDSEKSFVNSLMQMSQSIHEQDIVAKENELRRRENMITSLQTRIDALESTLARLLKERGKENDPNNKSMVDLNLWMSSSPRSVQKRAEAATEPVASTSARLLSPGVLVPETPPVKKSSKATKPTAPPPQPLQAVDHRAHKSLTAIDAEDEPLTDSDDDAPLSTILGKRSRPPTSTKTDDSDRPSRRLRAAPTRKVDPEPEKKLGEGTKSKQRKRR